MRCADCPFATKAIGSRGPIDSPFVIVGESPGSVELATGKPFMGPSGKMLTETLRAVGFDSLGCEPFVTNALSCYPKNKDLDKLAAGAHACSGRLNAQLSAHPRKVILALGNAAMWATTGDYSLKSLSARGRVIETPNGPVVLAVHPAYLLRNASAYSTWKKDLRQAVEIAQGQKPNQWTNPTWRALERPSEYVDLVKEYTDSSVRMITGDIETDHLHWFDGRMLCLGVTKGDGSHVDIIPESMLYGQPHMTKRLMEQGVWNWQNGLFDIKWFRKMGIRANVHEDTMLLSYTQNENGGYHDLDQIAQHWIKAPMHKNAMSKYYKPPYTSLRDAPLPELYLYNAIDLSKTHRVHAPLREVVNEDIHSKRLYERLLIPACDFIAEMQMYGVTLDVERVRENELEHIRLLEEINEEFQVYAEKHTGARINMGSPKQLGNLLYAHMGYGRIGTSTNAAALEDIARKYDLPPIINIILRYREVAKRKGTYITNLLDRWAPKSNSKKLHFFPGKLKADGRIHADFALHKTTTGRLAGSDPNLLNQPRGKIIRPQYVAAPGKIFCEVDLNQAELRSLALMSGDPLLLEIYTKNEVSIHDVTTGKFFAPKDEVMKGEEAYERVRRQLHLSTSISPKDVYGEAKMRGKAVNFGIVYGREAFSLAKEFNIPISEAQRWIDDWFDLYPGAKKFIDYCRRAPVEGRTLITVFGRRKRPGSVSLDNRRALENEFANFPHQSTASDIMLKTAIEVAPVLRQRWDANIWNEVYDAIYFELDADDVKLQESIEYVQGVITRIPPEHGLTRVPFLGDAKIGFDWGNMLDWKGTIEATGVEDKRTIRTLHETIAPLPAA